MPDRMAADETFITREINVQPVYSSTEEGNWMRRTVTGQEDFNLSVLGDVTRILSLPADERLANLQRFAKCVTVKFSRRQRSREEIDLAKLMPSMLLRSQEVWEYTSCAICLVDFGDGEELRRAPCAGGHAFHPKCLRGWLERSHPTCPVCRGGDERGAIERTAGRPSPDQLADYVMRRMRSGKVDFTISESNQRHAARVVKRMRNPVPSIEEEAQDSDEEGRKPKGIEGGLRPKALPAVPPEVANSTLPDIFAAHILARAREEKGREGIS